MLRRARAVSNWLASASAQPSRLGCSTSSASARGLPSGRPSSSTADNDRSKSCSLICSACQAGAIGPDCFASTCFHRRAICVTVTACRAAVCCPYSTLAESSKDACWFRRSDAWCQGVAYSSYFTDRSATWMRVSCQLGKWVADCLESRFAISPNETPLRIDSSTNCAM